MTSSHTVTASDRLANLIEQRRRTDNLAYLDLHRTRLEEWRSAGLQIAEALTDEQEVAK